MREVVDIPSTETQQGPGGGSKMDAKEGGLVPPAEWMTGYRVSSASPSWGWQEG